jgi:hypothetical protein
MQGRAERPQNCHPNCLATFVRQDISNTNQRNREYISPKHTLLPIGEHVPYLETHMTKNTMMPTRLKGCHMHITLVYLDLGIALPRAYHLAERSDWGTPDRA